MSSVRDTAAATTALIGDVTLRMLKLKGITFETPIIERYRRRESSVEEALIEMLLTGVSVRRVEDITEALCGSKVSPVTISELNKKAYVHIEDWRNRPLQGGHYPYVYVDGIYLRRNWGGEFENVAILVAISVNEDGYREVLGAAEGMKEDKASWVSFFQWGYEAVAWMALNWWLATSVLVYWRLWEEYFPKLNTNTNGVPSTFTAMYSPSRPAPRQSW